MSILKALDNEQGWLKAGFLGFPKSGKTHTAMLLAIGTRKAMKLKGPVAMYDTESGSNYIAEMVKKETGVALLGVRGRSFQTLMDTAKACLEEKVSVLVVDSISHPWKELCDSYLVQLNDKRKAKNQYPLQKLEFQHWAAVKGLWQSWSDFYLNSPLHIIICGRAGYEYDMEKNDETGRKELVKTGIKMRVEGEFGFEPSLLVEMDREQVPDGNGAWKIKRKATILGDRFNQIDGKEAYDPTFDFFLPHVAKLVKGAHSPVDTQSKTETGADAEGNTEWERERKTRTILCEEAQGLIVSLYPGQTSAEKKAKVDLIEQCFGTRSWTAVESMDSGKLRVALDALRKHVESVKAKEPAKAEDDVPN
jgi:hypothetical protein